MLNMTAYDKRGGIPILQLKDVFRRVLKAARLLSRSRDLDVTFVFQLRDIREAQNVSQAELADRMNVSQSKISIFESVYIAVTMEFLISYARILGYGIIVCETKDMTNPLPLSMTGVSNISAQRRTRQIISELAAARKSIEKESLLKHQLKIPDNTKDAERIQRMADKTFGVTAEDIRRFETDDDYIPDAEFVFRYASHLRMALRLSGPPTLAVDKYSEFLLVLRSVRESYGITQGEMGALMGVSQETISKFEAAKQDVKLDFLVFYASLLGYDIRVGSTFMSRGELARFRRRQFWISKALWDIKQWQIEDIYHSGFHRRVKWPEAAVEENANRIRSELRNAKRIKGLTTKKLSEELGVSDRTIRRFERERNYMPFASLAFKYASLVDMELKLEKGLQRKREKLGTFYLRRILTLYSWIMKPPGRESVNGFESREGGTHTCP
jgi:transcriptional regulator with XRE-family HTH domain